MSDLNNRLLRYIDRLEEPVSLEETMTRPEHRRFRVTAAVLAGAAIVLVPALVLIGLRFLPAGDDVSGSTLLPETTTTVIPEGNVTTTTSFQVTTDAPGSVVVPDLAGLTADEARAQLADLHLALEITEQYPSRNGFGSITAQSPVAGESVAAGSTIEVGVQVKAGCLDYQPEITTARSTTVQVLLECGRDWLYPDVSSPVTRVEPIADPIEATMRALLAGPTDEERSMGFSSSFTELNADALNSISLDNRRLTVDFNDHVRVDNVSTSTGSRYFLADLQANLFQFPEVDSVEFQLNGTCAGFWGMLERDCQVVTRSQWEQQIAAWDAERLLQPTPEDEIGTKDVTGNTFTTGYGDDPSRVMSIDGAGELHATGFSESEGWLLDDQATDPETWMNWAAHVTGLNDDMVWLVAGNDHTGDGSLVYTARAVLVIPWDEILPVMHGDPFIQSGASACTRNGESDPRLVVATETAENEDGSIAQYTNPLRAWLINVETGVFEEIPIDGVACLFQLA
ncbi:MAG: PASTA domain-containing protein [Acidimicrobiia bacterium]